MKLETCSIFLGLAVTLSVQGCGGADRLAALQNGIPLVNVIREPSGKETVLTGLIHPKMDFSSTFVVSSADGLDCNGQFNNAGVGAMTCTNGWALALQVPKEKYGTMTGSYAEVVDGIGAAVGWGDEANAAFLRGLM